MTTGKRDLRTGRTLWLSRGGPSARHAALRRDLRTEILIVGAGISGAFMAETLAGRHKVTVIDRRGIARGSTAASTALIAAEIDQPLTHLARQIGQEDAMRVWRRSALSVQAIAARARFLGIAEAARMEPRDSLYLAGNILDPAGLEAEAAARRSAGIAAAYLTRGAVKERTGITGRAGLLAFGNLTADPVRLAAGHLAAAAERGVRVFAPVEASAMEVHRRGVAIATAGGPVIEADEVIFCTGYEMPSFLTTPRARVISTYAFATPPQKRNLWPTACMIWEASDPYLYIRDTPDGRVVCGGEDEEFAEEAARDALLPKKIATLRRKLARMLPGIRTEPEFAWAGSFGDSDTGLPIIGRVPHHRHVWAVLGFGGNGTTYSRIAADIVSTALEGGSDGDADLFAFRDGEVKRGR